MICRWLVKKGRLDKANQVLHKVRHREKEEDIKDELADIEFTVQNQTTSLLKLMREFLRWRILERYCIYCNDSTRIDGDNPSTCIYIVVVVQGLMVIIHVHVHMLFRQVFLWSIVITLIIIICVSHD